MKRNVLLRARSLCATIARVQPSPANSHSPTKFSSSVSSEPKRSRPEPANRHRQPFFRQWLDIWRSRNIGQAVNWTLITTKPAPPSGERNQRGNHGQTR
jgi:hypothetical protein